MIDENCESLESLAFVVSTLGRADLLKRLLSSLRGQLLLGDHVVVVAQGNLDEIRSVCGEFPDLPITVTTSEIGSSVGRNTGVNALPQGDFVLHFPNDSSWFPEGVIMEVRKIVSRGEFVMGGMRVLDHVGGSRFAIPPVGTTLDRINVWRVIEMGLLIRRSEFETIGGFNTSLGTGAATPWQSAEGTDLLLRALAASPWLAHAFVWFPQEIAVGGVAESYGLTRAERRHKLRAYGRGLGMVAKLHRYPLGWRFERLLGGATVGLRHPREHDILEGLWVFMGRLEGMLGRTFGRTNEQAVSR